MNISQFGVTKIELCNRYTSNSGQRRIRLTAMEWLGTQHVQTVSEITLYGNTGALEALPHSDDFTDHDAPEPADKSQIDIEDVLAAAEPPKAEEMWSSPVAGLTTEQLTEIDAEAEAAQLPVEAHIPTASEEPDPNYVDRHA